MKTSDPKPVTVVLEDPTSLALHPVARLLPELSDDDPEFVALLEDIRDRGILDPIKICEQNRILDGRHRWRAAKKLKLPLVPTITYGEEDAHPIILHSLLLRRHYSKGARAYFAYPLLREEYKRAQLQGTAGVTVESLAERVGISKSLFKSAGQLHEIFERDPEYKDLVLPKILSGESGLGALIAGFAGRQATKSKARKDSNQLDLFSRTFDDLDTRYQYWTKFDDESKQQALTRVAKSVTAMPDDLLTEFQRRITAEVKRRKTEA